MAVAIRLMSKTSVFFVDMLCKILLSVVLYRETLMFLEGTSFTHIKFILRESLISLIPQTISSYRYEKQISSPYQVYAANFMKIVSIINII